MNTVIPVLDLKDGSVVQAIRGERDSYRPIRSRLAESPDPAVVAQAFVDSLATKEMYLADIDALQGRSMNRCVLAELTRLDVEFIVDRGVRRAEELEEVFELGGTQAVVAVETVASPTDAANWLKEFGDGRLVAGIDLKSGQSLHAPGSDWHDTPEQICEQFLEAGFCDFLVLDLAGVGSANGLPTLDLCRTLKSHPLVRRVFTGGGVRSVADLKPAWDAGVDSVLVSTALHTGTLRPEDLV